jgi:cytochrome c553
MSAWNSRLSGPARDRGAAGGVCGWPFAAAAALLAVAAHAGDPAAGRDAAGQCRTCHGIDGVGRMPNVPNLAGQSEIYLQKQLRAFRSGERQAPQMSVIAAGLSDEDIDNLAAWYASIEIIVNVPEK